MLFCTTRLTSGRDKLNAGRFPPSPSFRSSELSSPSEIVSLLSLPERGIPLAFEAIMNEVTQLHSVSTRLEGLAEDHPPVGTELLTIAGNVRNVATVLEVLVATKLTSGGEDAARRKPI